MDLERITALVEGEYGAYEISEATIREMTREEMGQLESLLQTLVDAHPEYVFNVQDNFETGGIIIWWKKQNVASTNES